MTPRIGRCIPGSVARMAFYPLLRQRFSQSAKRLRVAPSPGCCAAGAPSAPTRQARRSRADIAALPAASRNHPITARLVRAHKLIATEDLAPSNMTVSAKGRAEKPGKERQGKGGAQPRDSRRHAGRVPDYAEHQGGRSWVQADRLEYPQGEAVSDVPLLWDRSQEGLG